MSKLIVVVLLVLAMSLRSMARAARASDRVLTRSEASLAQKAALRREQVWNREDAAAGCKYAQQWVD
jgi:hypothetical protein